MFHGEHPKGSACIAQYNEGTKEKKKQGGNPSKGVGIK